MRLRTVFICLMIFFTASLTAAQAEVKVNAVVDRTAIAPGESLQLTVTIDGGRGEVDTSAIADFQVASQGSSTSLQFINGRSSRQEIYQFILVPADPRKKQLHIPALSVTVDGKTHATEAMSIRVEAVAAPGDGNAAEDVWVTAEVSARSPFVGQQFIYTFTLYNAVQVSDARFQPPEFQGFLAREIEQRRSQRQIINGREVAVAHIDYVLIPQAAGPYTIEPAAAQVGIVRPNRQRRQMPFDDFFDSPFLDRGSRTPKVVRTPPLTVDVRPLPEYSGTPPFSGVVGRFELSAEVETTQLKVGDSTTLVIALQGEGNIMDAGMPEFKIEEGFKLYADAPLEEIGLSSTGYTGRKVFRIALVPVKPGVFELPAVNWLYFDVAQKAYRVLSVPLPVVHVQPGGDEQAEELLVKAPTAAPQKQAVQFTSRDILPIKEGMDVLRSPRELSDLGFIIALVVPAALFGGVMGVQRMRRPDPSPSARMKAKARKALAGAKSAQADPQQFLTHLYQALTAAILGSAGRSGEALTWKEAESLLIQSGRDPQLARQAAQTLSTIESAKFSGGTLDSEQARGLLAQTRALIRRLAA